LDVIVKSTGASAKTAISSSTEFIGAVADSRPVPTQHLAAMSPVGRRFNCTWSQREPGATNQGLLKYLYSGAALS
jgi:hypothetical protein